MANGIRQINFYPTISYFLFATFSLKSSSPLTVVSILGTHCFCLVLVPLFRLSLSLSSSPCYLLISPCRGEDILWLICCPCYSQLDGDRCGTGQFPFVPSFAYFVSCFSPSWDWNFILFLSSVLLLFLIFLWAAFLCWLFADFFSFFVFLLVFCSHDFLFLFCLALLHLRVEGWGWGWGWGWCWAGRKEIISWLGGKLRSWAPAIEIPLSCLPDRQTDAWSVLHAPGVSWTAFPT